MGWDNMFRPSEGDNNPEKPRRIPADSPSTKFNAFDFFKATQAGEIAEPIADRDKPEYKPESPADAAVRQDLPRAPKPDQDPAEASDDAESARPDHNLDTNDDSDQDPAADETSETDDEAHTLDDPLDAAEPEPARPDQREAHTNGSETRLDWASVRSETQIQLGVPADARQEPGNSAGRDGSPDGSQRPETAQTVEIAAHDFDKPRTPFAARTDLAPSTLYRVEGRGDFYTDMASTVNYVETSYGGRGSLNYDLMKPRPDATYVVHPDITNPVVGADHAHVYRTGEIGRTIYVRTEALAIGEADRSESVQGRTGDEGGEGYDGGHLFGTSFGGGGEYANVVAMLREVNRGKSDSYYNLENQWRAMLREIPPPKITVDIQVHYPENSTVPDSFEVEYSINDGEPEQKEYKNG